MPLNLHRPAPPTTVPSTGGGDYFSASQHKTWTMCQRKWWMERVARVKDNRPRTFLAVGKALHAVSERYLLQNTTTWDGLFPKGWDAGLTVEQAAFIRKGAQQAVELGVWAATPGVKIEEPVMYLVGPKFRDHRGLPMVVRPVTTVDADGERKHAEPVCMYDNSRLPPGWNDLPRYIGFIDVLKVAQAKVEDHKSAKNRRYASTPAKLAKDGQLLSYAPLVLHLRPDLTEVTIQHNVFLKDPEDKKPTYAVQAQVSLAAAVAHWDTVIQHVQETKVLRQRVTALPDPLHRADRFLEVPGAADEGEARIKEACDAYSGCPYRDMCMMRCTAAQMVARMDVPVAALTQPPKPAPPVPSLRDRFTTPTSAPLMRPFTTTPTTDQTMPFPPKIAPILVGQDVYLLDPENATVQFRARLFHNDGGEHVTVALFPHVDVLPDFHKLGPMYTILVPRASLLPVADLTAKITGYQAALIAGGYTPFSTQWTTAAGEVIDDAIKVARVNGGPQPAPVNTASVPATTVQTGAATPGAAQVAQMTRSKEAESAANEVIPAATFVPAEGQFVTVAPTTHPFWSKLVGKIGVITDVLPGDGGTHVLNVEIEGFDYPTVAAGRFVLGGKTEVAQYVPPLGSTAFPVETTADGHIKGLGTTKPGGEFVPLYPQVGPQSTLVGEVKDMVPPKDPIFIQPGIEGGICTPIAVATAKLWIGKLVKVTCPGKGPIIATLEDANSEGIAMIFGQVKLAWDQIESIALHDPAAIPPGGKAPKAPKLTPEEKAAAKAAEKAQEEAKAAQEAEALRLANRPRSLQYAVDHLTEFLAGAKVTRKMLETLQPLLAEALLHQQELTEAMDQADSLGVPTNWGVPTN